MTALNLEELRAAAEAAQKANADNGAWEHAQDREGIRDVGNDFSSICLFGYLREDDHVWIPFDDAETFATFIAAANPETVLALIERAEQADVLEAENERLRDGLRAVHQYGRDTLSGPTDADQDNRNWQRTGVVEMVRRSAAVLNGLSWELLTDTLGGASS